MFCFTGIDIGSAFSKAVIIARSKIASYYIIPSGGNYRLTADEVLKEALRKTDLSFDNIAYTVITGYGAASVSFSNQIVTDISCQGKGISYLLPSVRTVIDIGDMNTKVFKLDDRGRPRAFLLSGKCAGGSGRVLQVIAHVLRLDLREIGELSLRSKNKVDFNTGCAVFAETEAVSRVAEGALKEDLLSGVHRALAAQIQSLVGRIGLEPDCALIGGGAKDAGLIKSMEEILGISLLIPEEPQIVAALGAALIAKEKVPSVKA